MPDPTIDIHPESNPVVVTLDRLGRDKYSAWLGTFPLAMNVTQPEHYAAIALQILGHTGWMVLRDRGAMHDNFKPATIDWWARHFADAANAFFISLTKEKYAKHRARVQAFLDDPDATRIDEGDDA